MVYSSKYGLSRAAAKWKWLACMPLSLSNNASLHGAQPHSLCVAPSTSSLFLCAGLSCAVNAAFVVLAALYFHASINAHQSHPSRPCDHQQAAANTNLQFEKELQVSGQIVSVNPRVPDLPDPVPEPVHHLDPEPEPVLSTKEGRCKQPAPDNTPWLSSLRTWQVAPL